MYFIPYMLLFLITLAFSIPVSNGKRISNCEFIKMEYFYILGFFILFLGLRGCIYTDWINYERYFRIAPKFSDGYEKIVRYFEKCNYEKGYLVLTILFKSIYDNYFFLQFLIVCFNCIVLFSFFKEFSKENPCLCFLILLSFYGLSISINLLRNSIAISFFIISIKYINKKDFKRYCILNFCGFLFHSSSIIYIPLYFFLKKKHKKYFILFFFCVGLVFYLLKIRWLASLLQILVSPFANTATRKILGYLSSDTFSSAYGLSIGFIERSINFVALYKTQDKLLEKNSNLLPIVNLAYLYFFTWLFGSEMYILVQRLPLLFVCSYWVLIPNIYQTIKGRGKKIFYIYFILLIGFLKIIKDNNNIITYYDNLIFGIQSIEVRKRTLLNNMDLLR